MKQNLLDLNYEDLKSFLNSKLGIEEKKLNMRAQQIFTAVYQKGLNNFNQLTTIPIELREILKKNILNHHNLDLINFVSFYLTRLLMVERGIVKPLSIEVKVYLGLF